MIVLFVEAVFDMICIIKKNLNLPSTQDDKQDMYYLKCQSVVHSKFET